jgi:hypothetical protein
VRAGGALVLRDGPCGPPQHEGLRGWLDAWFCSTPFTLSPHPEERSKSASRRRIQRAPEVPSRFETPAHAGSSAGGLWGGPQRSRAGIRPRAAAMESAIAA